MKSECACPQINIFERRYASKGGQASCVPNPKLTAKALGGGRSSNKLDLAILIQVKNGGLGPQNTNFWISKPEFANIKNVTRLQLQSEPSWKQQQGGLRLGGNSSWLHALLQLFCESLFSWCECWNELKERMEEFSLSAKKLRLGLGTEHVNFWNSSPSFVFNAWGENWSGCSMILTRVPPAKFI